MKKGLVVVATHNGKDHVKKLIRSMRDKGHSFNEWPVLIMDTGSTDDSPEYFEQIAKQSKGKILFDRTPYRFATGAYIYAYETQTDFDRFVFIHDSMEVKDGKWADAFVKAEKKADSQAAAWLVFPFFFDSKEQQLWIADIYGKESQIPQFGIFGCIFTVSRKVLDQFRDAGYLSTFADDKWQECGFERGWAVGFNNLGMDFATVEEALFHDSLLTNDGYTYLTKHRPGRH